MNVEVLTAARSERQQRRFAGSLRALGLRAGDRVALQVPGSTALVSAVLGALRSGVVPVLVDRSLTAPERAQLLEDARARPGRG